MNRHRALASCLFSVAALLLFAACGDDNEPSAPLGTGEGAAPDFSLLDVNPNSATSGQAVSPRNYLGKVSAWYFGHAT